MATYTITINGYANNPACMILVNDALIPYGTTTYTVESGADIYVETDNDVYVDGVRQSNYSWESTATSNLLIEYDGLDAHVTTNYSGGGSGGSGGSGGKTLIGGTAYSIAGGRVLIGGTAYSIDKGKTMVGGTVYEIAFGLSAITVNITGAGNTTYTYVTINGTKYTKSATVVIAPGTEISFYAYSSSTLARKNCKIDLNGVTVSQGTTSYPASYKFVPTTATVNIAMSGSVASKGSIIAITTS